MNPQKTQEPFPIPATRMCHWYYKGALDMKPSIAIITAIGRDGIVDLTIFPPGQRDLTTAHGVRHADDPYHMDHPGCRQESGSWNYLPGQDPRVAEPNLDDESPRSVGSTYRKGVK